MRKLLIIGIGAGNPEHLTLEAIAALNRADVFVIPDKGSDKTALRRLRLEICERFVAGRSPRLVPVPIPLRDAGRAYRDGVDEWHARLATDYGAMVEAHVAPGGCGAFLVWGDPALYDSTIRIVERMMAAGLSLDHEVVPGISSVQVLAARHRIPLNGIGEPVLITTGRRLGDSFPEDAGSVVVMLDGEQAFTRLADEDVEIYWGAYLGTPDEILIAGPLSETKEEILRVRSEARADKGWIMDTYLLRRRGAG